WTVRQIGIWENGGTLWSHVMKFEKETNSLPYVNRGQYNRNKLGNYSAALSDYSKAISIDKDNPELYNSRGKTYFDMAMSGKFQSQENSLVQKALDDYNMGLAQPKIKPKSKAEILINRGAALGSRQQFAEAIQSLNEGIALDSTNKNGYFNRSIALYTVSQTNDKEKQVLYLNKALADYRKYLQFDPNNANVWYESGMIQRSLNRNPEAIIALGQAIRLHPNFGLAYLERARAQAQAGNKSGAQQDYQRAQQLGSPMEPSDAKLMGQ
ncbi:MAG: tetratricopeptide repeat protein, partial [Saprospiraceae bacterium]